MSHHQQEPYHFDAGSLGHLVGLTLTTSNNTPAVHYFGGLPYAQAPTGAYRFRPPRKLPPDYQYGTTTTPGQFTHGTKICPQPPSSATPSPSSVSEDCLQLNMWIPAGPAPTKQGGGAWPVLFYIHGGYLQVGNANLHPEALVPLLSSSSSAMRAIIILPSYRLNALGFLASTQLASEARARGEPAGNMGFWDQRAALEWMYENIKWFGGDAENITVAGYSAGGNSAFQQLAHEVLRCGSSDEKRKGKGIIRRVAMFSNSPGVKPKTLHEQQEQFDEFVTRLGIPMALSDTEKLDKLRGLPYQRLVEVQSEMKVSEFRGTADDGFYPLELIDEINSGGFARSLKDRGFTLLHGECQDEHVMYRRWRTPGDSYGAVYERFKAEYSKKVTDVLMRHYCGAEKDLPAGYKDWQDFFGRVYAGIQVHHLERGFHNALFEGGLQPGKDVLRYRFERRLACVEERIPKEWGVTHLTDIPIWLWGYDYAAGLTDQEREWLKGWNEGFAAFVNGDPVSWGPTKPKEMRRWRSDGETDVWEDSMWDEGVAFWKIVNSGSGEGK